MISAEELKQTILVDKELRKKVTAQHDQKVASQNQVIQEKAELQETGWNEIKARVQKEKADLDAALAQVVSQQQKHLESGEKHLNQLFSKKHQEWLDTLFKRCLDQ
ncbi:MAG: hypothetical protein LBR25_05205 [Erysipelotrichaceae bacterium]|jgi:hypothetical protein|nr:hypothetical protein [Erysipelotrichaceae bacterium]